MKKKVEPKPTKVSKHYAPYTFQQKSINLHPLTGQPTMNIKQYAPHSYVMGHTSHVPDMPESPVPLHSQTYHPLQSSANSMTSVSCSEFGSFFQSDSFGGDGLSTDGMEIYDPNNNNHFEEPVISHMASRQQFVNNNREKIVKSAPASFPGKGRNVAIADFEKVRVDETSPDAQKLKTIEDDQDFQWLMDSAYAAIESQPPSRLPSAIPNKRRAPSASIGRAPSARPISSSMLNNSASLGGSNGIDISHERLVLGWIDKELEEHIEVGDDESEEVLQLDKPQTTTGVTADTADENIDGIGFENIHDDESEVSVDFWQGYNGKTAGVSSKQHAVALTRGSLLALIDDHKHDTSVKHTREAGIDFFSAAAAAAAAVGLDDMADKLIRTKSRDGGTDEEVEIDVDDESSHDPSRPESPFGVGTGSDEDGVGFNNNASSGGGGVPVDWAGAFASSNEIAFDKSKIHRSKSMEPRIGSMAASANTGTTNAAVIVPSSAKEHRSISAKVGKSAKSNKNLTVRIEDYLDGIVDISESDNGTPFKTVQPGRRNSFSGFPPELGVSAGSPKVIDSKSGKVKYFSYLYKTKKKRGKSANAPAKAVEVTTPVDPFEAGRSERLSSPPNLLTIMPRGSDEDLKPKPVVDLERKYSAPGASGPIWGHIPNYMNKPDRPLSTISNGGRAGSPQVPSRPASRARTPVIRGLIKKFSFEGESLRSPFLHHMTKDRHKEKYGDAQRKQRAMEKAKSMSCTANLDNPHSSQPSSPKNKSKSMQQVQKPIKIAPITLSTPSVSESREEKLPNFDTSVEKPRNPFHRQNSWQREPDAAAVAIADLTAFTAAKSRKPFTLSRQNTFEGAVAVGFSETDGSSYSQMSSARNQFSRQNTIDRENNEFAGSVESARQSSTARSSLSQEPISRPGVLSRQNTLERPGALSRQNSSVLIQQQSGSVLSRQNSSVLAVSSGPAKGISDLQALINSINRVLVAPAPLKYSRPADVFAKASMMFDTSSPLSSGKNGGASTDLDEDSSPPSILSRGNSFKSSTPRKGLSSSRLQNNSSPTRAGDSLISIALTNPPIVETTSRPSTRGGVSFSPNLSASPLPVISESIMKYVPSERRGSLNSLDSIGDLALFDGVSAAMQRRKSVAAMQRVNTRGNIDSLVSARRASFLAGVEPPASPLPETLTPTTPTVPSSPWMRQQSEVMSCSRDLTVNPIMEDYYDAEEGLQDTGVIIANLHADPLYRILREEVERIENTITHPQNFHSTGAIHSGILQGQLSRPQSSNGAQQTATKPPRPTRSANGLSNYKSRMLDTVIYPPDLKVLGTFRCLPPAAWVTCRVVYFLIMAFYECVPRVGRHYEYRSYLSAEPLWALLEKQIQERQLCMEEVELQYSWPLMQTILTQCPVLVAKTIQAIEHGIPESVGNANERDCPCFLPSVFFDAFPPTKLIYLRDLIKQGMGLFQASELMLVVPVCAQLCDWAKRVIAQIYASCITRLRATQSNTKKVSSVLHSTVPPYVPSDESSDTPVWEKTDAAPILLPPNFKFVLIVEDALEETSFIGMHSLDSYTALENMHGSGGPLSSLSHTLEKGLNLVKPCDHLDLLLVPPGLSDLSMYVGSSNIYGSTNGFVSAMNSLDGDPLLKVQRDWTLVKQSYERHLQHYAASPLHRVLLLPPALTAPSASNLDIELSQHERDVLSRIEEFLSEQKGRNLHSGSNQSSREVYRMQYEGVHPVVEHCLSFAGSAVLNPAKNKPEADILITRLRDGHLPAFLPPKNEKNEEEGLLSVKFSLVLVDDKAPVLRRPLSPFSCSMQAMQAMQSKLQHAVQEAVASTVGPNRFVIAIADTPHSWLAFQMICRIARPSDSITLVHIPVIPPPFGGKVGLVDEHRTAEKNAYFTLREYQRQYERCVRRIEHLLNVYKNAGYNLYVEQIPSFQEEMHRQLVYIQRKNYFHAQLVRKQREIQTAAAATAASLSSAKNSKQVPLVSRTLSPASPLGEVGQESAFEANIAVRLFVQNQHTYHLATRILAVARKLEASFLVVGVNSEDIIKAITAPPKPAHFGDPIPTRNLSFPFQEVVPDNYRPHDELDSLMSAKKVHRQRGVPPPDAGAWLEEFVRYTDQKIDLSEMLLHQYGNQKFGHAHGDRVASHAHGEPQSLHRFSFILSNCQSLL